MPLFSLKNQRKFDLVNRKGKKISTKYFTLVVAKDFNLIKNLEPAANKTLPNNIANKTISHDFSPTFLGMKVSKKLSKKACVRNKIKRRIRHLIRLMMKDPDLDLLKTAIIFIPYKNFEVVNFAELISVLKNALMPKMSVLNKYSRLI